MRGIIIILFPVLIIFTLISNLSYNSSLPKVTTVEARQDLYSITKKYSAEFFYTALKGYFLPCDIRIDEILITEGCKIKKGDRLLKVSTIEPEYLFAITSQIEENNRTLEILNKEYELNKSRYSEKLYAAQLEADIAKLQQEQKQQWYKTNGGIKLSIEILEFEIAVLHEENALLINKAATNNDLSKMQLEAEMQALTQSINTAQAEEEKQKLQQQYDLVKLEYDILMQAFSENRRELAIRKNTAAIAEKNEQIELLKLKESEISTLNEQIQAKKTELDAFKRNKTNETTIKLKSALNAIEALVSKTTALTNSIQALKSISENNGYILAGDSFTVHKINAGIDKVHPANENIFTHTTAESQPCIKWNTDKTAFNNNFSLGSEVNVKYLSGDAYMHETIKVSSKMQLADSTEYIGIINLDKAAVTDCTISMTHNKNEYVTYLPKTALHTSPYKEQIVYAVQERDSIFKRESFVKELPVEILAEDERNYIVKILSDSTQIRRYAAQISTPVKDGDIVKVVQQFEAEGTKSQSFDNSAPPQN